MSNAATTSAATSTNTNPLLGTNFWVQAILFVTSIFGGMSQTTAGMIVAAVTGGIAAFFAIRTWIVSAKFNKNVLHDVNFWAYLTNMLVGFLPQATDLIPALKSLVDALYSGNWGQIISGGVSFISIIYYTFFKKKVTTTT